MIIIKVNITKCMYKITRFLLRKVPIEMGFALGLFAGTKILLDLLQEQSFSMTYKVGKYLMCIESLPTLQKQLLLKDCH